MKEKFIKLMSGTRGKLIIAIIVLLIVAAVAVILMEALTTDEEPEKEYDKLTRFNTEEVDWEEDIFKDSEYLECNRLIYYSTGTQEFLLEIDNEEIEDSAHIFLDYIDAIIKGDRERVNSFYTEEFIEDIESYADKAESKRHPFYNCVTQDFTMQRVYDVTLTFVGKPIDDTGMQYYYYILEYKIMKNNGTFLDVIGENSGGNDTYLPQHIKVINVDGEYKINYLDYVIPEELQ